MTEPNAQKISSDENSSNSSTINLTNGNTKRQISPAKHWCFTHNNYTQQDIEKLCSSIVPVKYVFQEETGTEGTKHLQGYVEFKKKIRPKSLGWSDQIHWEKCRNIKASIAYCKIGS